LVEIYALHHEYICCNIIGVSVKDLNAQGEKQMKLTPPKVITFWISVVLAVIGFLGVIITIPFISTYAFWFLFAGFVLLVLGLLVKGL
jgi:hypothetical protein